MGITARESIHTNRRRETDWSDWIKKKWENGPTSD